jgi:hypothetical protein
MPIASSEKGTIVLPALESSLSSRTGTNDRVIRLFDSRAIQAAIRQRREEPALSLGGKAQIALGILAGAALYYLLQDDDDDDDCGISIGLPRSCDYR